MLRLIFLNQNRLGSQSLIGIYLWFCWHFVPYLCWWCFKYCLMSQSCKKAVLLVLLPFVILRVNHLLCAVTPCVHLRFWNHKNLKSACSQVQKLTPCCYRCWWLIYCCFTVKAINLLTVGDIRVPPSGQGTSAPSWAAPNKWPISCARRVGPPTFW